VSAVSRERVQAVIHESTRRPPARPFIYTGILGAHTSRRRHAAAAARRSGRQGGRAAGRQGRKGEGAERAEGATVAHDIFPLIPKERVRSDDTDGRYRVYRGRDSCGRPQGRRM